MKQIVTFLSLLIFNFTQSQIVAVQSPSNKIKLMLTLENGRAYYSLSLSGNEFILKSPLGLKSSIGDFTSGLKLVRHDEKKINESYNLDRSKTSKVNYIASEAKFTFTNVSNDTLHTVFRITDRDAAFCYIIPKNGRKRSECTITEEATGFKVPKNSTAYITPQAPPMSGWEKTKPSYEEEYTREEPVGKASQYGLGFTYPALFHIDNRGWMLISETGISGNYPGTRLSDPNDELLYHVAFPQEGENNGREAVTATGMLPMQTSWKTITMGNDLKPIVESTSATDVVKPVAVSSHVFSPGRAAWSWIVWQDESCNYADQVKFIDLASNLKCEYVLIDALWDTNIGKQKMAELVQYAKSKNVEILLWYNSNGNWNSAPQSPKDKMNTPETRKEEMLWLQKTGIKGLKIDFFGGDKQATMQLYDGILKDATQYGLNINFHGTTLPRGWERMYPNYMTSEAVLASENLIFQQSFCDRYPETACIYPFTRNAVSAMDFGPVFLNKRLNRNPDKGNVRKTTDAFEMATAIIFFSPIQHWGLVPDNVQEKPAYLFDFLKKVPTVWDETLLIDGYPGKFCVMARRKGNKWYIGAINGENKAKKITIDLPMLKGRNVNIIRDASDSQSEFVKTDIKKKTLVTLELPANGGTVIYTP